MEILRPWERHSSIQIACTSQFVMTSPAQRSKKCLDQRVMQNTAEAIN